MVQVQNGEEANACRWILARLVTGALLVLPVSPPNCGEPVALGALCSHDISAGVSIGLSITLTSIL